jgi:hypothetical protein
MTRPNTGSGRLVRVATALLVIGALALGGCGSSTKTVSSTGSNGQVTTQTVPNVHFANAKFLFHAGLAFGAIHRYIYKPLRNGALRHGAPGRIRVLLKGAVAAVFAVHELKLAHEDALASNQLRPLANRVDSLDRKLGALVSGLKHGSIDPAAILSSSGAADALGSASHGLGFGIKDISRPLGG